MMAMLALAIGGDTLSNQARREAIIDGLFDLPSEFLLAEHLTVIEYILWCLVNGILHVLLDY